MDIGLVRFVTEEQDHLFEAWFGEPDFPKGLDEQIDANCAILDLPVAVRSTGNIWSGSGRGKLRPRKVRRRIGIPVDAY